jgi:RNA methyltransferase, TrmH family
VHAIKHALRFGAEIEVVVTSDAAMLSSLARSLAPDVADVMIARAQPISPELLARLVPNPPETRVVAIALRPRAEWQEIIATLSRRPIVWLESPSHIGNIGASVRAAAGAGALAVVTTGVHDPWHAAALRGSAGLHFALPVLRVDAVAAPDRPLIVIDGEGEPLRSGLLADGAIFAFGCERRGISPELRDRADRIVSIPMEPGVSSLNLATSVAVILYSWRLGLAPAK